MLLLEGIQQARRFKGGRASLPHTPRARWTQLSQVQCNPQAELEWFESRLDRPAPLTPSSVTRSPGFEPGEYRTTYHGGDQGLWQELAVAYQWMRLTEEAPYPPAIANVGLSKKLLHQTGEWLIEHDSVRTRTWILRLREERLTAKYLSRHRIAALDGAICSELHDLAVSSLEQSFPQSTSSEPRNDPAAEYRRRRLSTSIDVLARTVVRMPVETARRIWDSAMRLYHSPIIRSDAGGTDALFRLLRSMINSLPDDDLASRFRQIIELPIPDTKSFPVWNTLSWPDLTRSFEKRLICLPVHIVQLDWRKVAETLIEAARDRNPDVRHRAVVRLAALFRYGCLDEATSKEFASAYWSRLTPDGLPCVERMFAWGCLTLPEPEPQLSVERFRAYACKRQPDLAKSIALMQDWTGATRVASESAASPRRFVDWNGAEIVACSHR